MNGKNAATLLLISLMLCTFTIACLGSSASTITSHHTVSDGQQYFGGTENDALSHQLSPELIDGNASLINTSAVREIQIGNYGLVTVNDLIVVSNIGNVTAPSWTFYLQPDIYSGLRYIAAYGNGTKLSVDGASPFSSFIGLKVNFTAIGGLPKNKSLSITLIQEYSHIVYSVPTFESLALHFYKYIVSPYLTLNYTTNVKLPVGGSSPLPTHMVGLNVTPFNSTRLGPAIDGSYSYTASNPLVEVVRVDRLVELDVSGFLSSTETHYVKNIGPTDLTTLKFIEPLSIVDGSLAVSDSAGPLWPTVSGGIITVIPRYSLKTNWTYTYYVSYRTPAEDYRTFEGNLEVIGMRLVTTYNCSVDLESISVVFPPGTSLSSASGSYDAVSLTQGNKIMISYTYREVTFLNVDPVEFKYSQNIAETLQRPIFLILIIYAIAFLYVGIREVVPKVSGAKIARVEVEKERELSGTIKEFCTNYEDRVALTLEAERLMEDKTKGRVSKRAFLERLDVIRRRTAQLTNRINEEKNRLSATSKRYAAIVKQLNTFEEERENARASLENLDLRRRQGKVSGDVYNRLKLDNIKKIDKATSNIDRTIIELRQEIQ